MNINRRLRAGMSRRTFLRAAGLGGAAVTFGRWPAMASSPATPAAPVADAYVPRPNATQYALRVASTKLNPDGKQDVVGVTANGTFPGPEIRVRRGEQLRLRVENGLADDATSIHWHGLLVPAAMDGVPDVSNAPIAARGMYVYEFPILQTGTYWYHSHWRFQEQVGLAGAFIIEDDAPADHDVAVIFSDWLHRSPYQAYEALRSGKPAADKAPMPMQGGMQTPKTGATQMGSGGADLADITYDAFLLNGKSTSDPWVLAARPGERIRLRMINAGASTYFRIRLDGHPLQITHADGMAVEPVVVDHLLMGMAEAYDAIVTLSGSGSYTLHAMAMDGSGQALGILHTPDAAAKHNTAMPKFDGRELTYAALRAAETTTLPDGPPRSYRLALQGDMARYIWTIDGQVYPKADPLPVRLGERVQVELVNETMMWHPMHLHGHFFRLLQGAGERSPLKHTVNVAPRESVKIEFAADNGGRWIFHCHNLYHFEAGMARVFEYVV